MIPMILLTTISPEANPMMTFSHSDNFKVLPTLLAKTLPKIDVATKNAKNDAFRGSKYANLTSVVDVAKGPLGEAGIAILQPISTTEDGSAVTVTTLLLHESGEWISSSLTMRPDKPTPQGMGSAITYARRYSLSGLLGITADDDDGNAASGVSPQQQVAARTIEQLKNSKALTLDELLATPYSQAELMACNTLRKYYSPDIVEDIYSACIDGLQIPNDATQILERLFTYIEKGRKKNG
jgi:hypothetical protein